MKLNGAQAERFVAAPDAGIRAVLVFGPDGGLARERAGRIATAIAGNDGDVFRLVELQAAAVRDEPARLYEEAAAMSFTGGRRVIRVRGATDALSATLESFLAEDKGDSMVIVEGGDLPARSKLRRLFDTAPGAASLPCYADDAGSLDAVIRESLGRYGITLEDDAMLFLRDNLGSDRMVSRGELEKLALYVGDNGRVQLDDATACVGDSAAMTMDDIVYATASGNIGGLTRRLDRGFAEGMSAVAVLRAVARHLQRLQLAASLIAGGKRADDAVKALRPPVFFRRVDAFRGQLPRWPAAVIDRALVALNEAEITCKTTNMPAPAVCAQTLLRLARHASGANRR